MLSEPRKFGVGMVLAHQYLHQLEPAIRHAVLRNAGTIISFRLGPEDALFVARDVSHIHIYLQLMIEGTPSRLTSARNPLPERRFLVPSIAMRFLSLSALIEQGPLRRRHFTEALSSNVGPARLALSARVERLGQRTSA
jgi:hypothetical protein